MVTLSIMGNFQMLDFPTNPMAIMLTRQEEPASNVYAVSRHQKI